MAASSSAIEHGAGVRIEARADVLDIEHQRVDAAQHLRRQPEAAVVVQAEDGQPGGLIARIGDVRAILAARDPVLGSEQRGHLHARREHHVDVAAALAIDAGLIGEQADRWPFKRSEASLARARRVPSALDVILRAETQPARGDRRDGPAPFVDAAPALRMDAVGHDHDERFAGGVDPQRRGR